MSNQNSKSEILVTATKMFAEHGYHGTSIRAIASALNINIATVYYHYGSKDGLYREVFHSEFLQEKELLSRMVEKATDEIISDAARFCEYFLNLVHSYFELHRKSPQLMRLWYYRWLEFPDQGDAIDMEFARPLYQLIVELLERAMKAGTIQPQPVDLHMWVVGLIWILNGYLFGRKPKFLVNIPEPEGDISLEVNALLDQYVLKLLNFQTLTVR
jgi:AcrR family transcriptional regulator